MKRLLLGAGVVTGIPCAVIASILASGKVTSIACLKAKSNNFK